MIESKIKDKKNQELYVLYLMYCKCICFPFDYLLSERSKRRCGKETQLDKITDSTNINRRVPLESRICAKWWRRHVVVPIGQLMTVDDSC